MACAFAADAEGQNAPPPALLYIIRAESWSQNDEKEFGRFIVELGESGCATVDACLHDKRNPYRGSDTPGLYFRADCADFPYVLRFYYAWKRGLPFSYESIVEPRGATRDVRYTYHGNAVAERTEPISGVSSGAAIIEAMNEAISSATYRIHPELEEPYRQDFYSPDIQPGAIHPGTVIYDPNGHLASVWRIDPDGRIHYLDAHPDHSVTRGFYDLRFVRAFPAMGAGFKNWRPQKLVGAIKQADGSFSGGHIELAANRDLADFSVEQFYGNGPRPADDSLWQTGAFTLNGETLDYYDFVRAQLAGGKLTFDPLREIADMVDSNCADLHYRADAVERALQNGIDKLPQPDRLPPNIYGTEGDWETYSTPSRDARLKTAFKELRDLAERFMHMNARRDPALVYAGRNLAADMLGVYTRHAASCIVTYKRSNGAPLVFGYEDARKRLFEMSFDPYACAERRWGARDGRELASCKDDELKTGWYEAERFLRNQIDRSYEARMDYTLEELQTPGPGKGVATPPDTDAVAYLKSLLTGANPVQNKTARPEKAEPPVIPLYRR